MYNSKLESYVSVFVKFNNTSLSIKVNMLFDKFIRFLIKLFILLIFMLKIFEISVILFIISKSSFKCGFINGINV